MSNPQISIIIPVYKAEQYLHRCLDSIVAQNFDNWECVLVNDGSPDCSGEICEVYATYDSRFRVFHQENGGASAARNLGLEKARGEWIAFVDCDDIVEPEYLHHLYEGTIQGSQFVMTNIRNFHIQIRENITLSGTDFVHYFVKNKIFALSGPVSKLFNLKIINYAALHFPIGIHMGEDGAFVIAYMNEIKKVSLFTYTDYIYIKTDESLTTKYYSFESELRCFELWRTEMLSLFEKWHVFDDNIKVAWQQRLADTFNRVCQTVYRSRRYPQLKEQVKLLRSIPEKYIEEYRHTPQADLKTRRKLLKWLITHRWFWVYVLIGKMDFYYLHK